MEDLVSKLRSQLNGRGGRTILGLGRQFRIMDDNGNRRLCWEEFTKGLHDYKVELDRGESEQLFRHLDRNGDG
jgi:Ca2+-binding EF-hand superfamily protein